MPKFSLTDSQLNRKSQSKLTSSWFSCSFFSAVRSPIWLRLSTISWFFSSRLISSKRSFSTLFNNASFCNSSPSTASSTLALVLTFWCSDILKNSSKCYQIIPTVKVISIFRTLTNLNGIPTKVHASIVPFCLNHCFKIIIKSFINFKQ